MAKKVSQEKQQLVKLADYKNVFNSAQGRRVLEDMCRNHFVFSTSFVKGDSYESARREGERLVILRILSHLKVDLAKYEKLIEEEQKNGRRYSSEYYAQSEPDPEY